MSFPEIKNCPGTLAEGYSTYSRACLARVFSGKKVSHVLPYDSPAFDTETNRLFEESRKRLSISGVQDKFSVILEKNKLRLVNEGERGTHILKPIPGAGKNPAQMPANEHLTMQIARQVFNIETAENALIFFRNGDAAYIIKRFDIKTDGSKIAQEDFAALAGRTPQTHGENYKYLGNYSEMFRLMKEYVPAYKPESSKLLKLLIFNYLFSNGDAHFKNFSLIETPMGDFKLSPAYDLLNSRIHIDDTDFALEDGLLPRSLSEGKIKHQFKILSNLAGIDERVFDDIFSEMVTRPGFVEKLVFSSFLNESTKRNYFQSYQGRLKQLLKE
jgi:serine/threonine-protein kinase HipA